MNVKSAVLESEVSKDAGSPSIFVQNVKLAHSSFVILFTVKIMCKVSQQLRNKIFVELRN